jgi:hypothetical protein
MFWKIIAFQVRGGTGIFTGPPAFVWISNQVGNNGVLTGFEQLNKPLLVPSSRMLMRIVQPIRNCRLLLSWRPLTRTSASRKFGAPTLALTINCRWALLPPLMAFTHAR